MVRSSHPQQAPRRRSRATPHKAACEDGGEMAVFQQPELAKALEDPHAPETRPARHTPDVAVLLELLGLHVIAGCQTATGAGRVVVGQHLAAEGAKVGAVPDILHPLVMQVA